MIQIKKVNQALSISNMMKIKNKGKVYPSPSHSSSTDGGYLSVFNLLPASIIALASLLPLEDREVLAYLITTSIKATTSTSSSSIIHRKTSKHTPATTHKPPLFDCDCFDCYTRYWFRWDSSPNRELIHQAIEAFEDHLSNVETQKSKKNGKPKRRDKTARRFGSNNNNNQVEDSKEPIMNVVAADEVLSDDVVLPVSSPIKDVEENVVIEFSGEPTTAWDEIIAVVRHTAEGGSCNHKGLARKVLPDVLGIFNSRLWSLWSPNA
ncbi:uncharacterized protein LOC123215859 [Mangifera indica]|uniref:uncharacterized protein LOC123215859 n=1 Tax=Mangifera indica TaxID=29780 RepID=UPI001CFAAFDF|nr:uncharacterized protein LOC123215859 [Mangifera indica]